VLLRRGKEAKNEFQKMVDHPGILINSPLRSLATLQLARSLFTSGNESESRKAFQEFFALWNDADPDIPILRKAKAEYAKLH